MIHALAEPLKVRTISKGNSLEYYLGKTFQKSMWNHLQKYQQFSLTGKPVDIEQLNEIIVQEDKLVSKINSCIKNEFSKLKRARNLYSRLPDSQKMYTNKILGPCDGFYDFKFDLGFDSWVSGDYKSATDKLRCAYTKEAFEAFLLRLPKTEIIQKLIIILRKTLYEHRLHYPKLVEEDIKKEYGTFVQQTVGQLMGSITSFPILCIINLVGYWISLEKYIVEILNSVSSTDMQSTLYSKLNLFSMIKDGEGFNLKLKVGDLPVKVNGDDILFRANEKFYTIWKETIAELGFELSVGKNYIHKKFLTVNSTLFSYQQSNRTFKLIDFFNVGLLMGRATRSTGNARPTDIIPIEDCYNEGIKGANDVFRFHQRFIHYNKPEVEKITQNGLYSLFLPKLFGGCGFILQQEMRNKVHFTGFQRKLCHFLRQRILHPFKVENKLDEIYIKFSSGVAKNANSVNLVIPQNLRGMTFLVISRSKEEVELDGVKYNLSDFKEQILPGVNLGSLEIEEVTEFSRPSGKLLKDFREWCKLRGINTPKVISEEILTSHDLRLTTIHPSSSPTN
jgi:hypothetical protein